MPAFSHLAMFAFGAVMGALVTLMVLNDDTRRSLDGLTAQLNERAVCLPVMKVK